jgi:hypothetical protein
MKEWEMVWIRGDGEVCARAPMWADTGIHWCVVVACVVGVCFSRSVHAVMTVLSLSFIVFQMCFWVTVSPHTGEKRLIGRLPHVV